MGVNRISRNSYNNKKSSFPETEKRHKRDGFKVPLGVEDAIR